MEGPVEGMLRASGANTNVPGVCVKALDVGKPPAVSLAVLTAALCQYSSVMSTRPDIWIDRDMVSKETYDPG